MNDNEKVEWVDVQGGKEVVYSKAPQISAWQRFTAQVIGLDPIEEQL